MTYCNRILIRLVHQLRMKDYQFEYCLIILPVIAFIIGYRLVTRK